MREVVEAVAIALFVGLIVAAFRQPSPLQWALVVPFLVAAATALALVRLAIQGFFGTAEPRPTSRPSVLLSAECPPYKRIRLMAAWLFLQSVLIMLVFAVTTGNVLLFVPLGVGLGAATAASMCLVWLLSHRSMEEQGFKW